MLPHTAEPGRGHDQWSGAAFFAVFKNARGRSDSGAGRET